MKVWLIFPALSLIGAAGMAAALQGSDSAERMLTGRVAGEPVSCVSLREITGNRSLGDGSILFETRSRDLVYVNRSEGGCRLGMGRALRTTTTANQLCRGDISEVLDTGTGLNAGSCVLGDFVPYRRDR